MARKIPNSVIKQYERAIKLQGNAAEKAVRNALNEYFKANPSATVAEAREFAIELMTTAGDMYGAATSQAAYDLLDAIAAQEGLTVPNMGDWYYKPDAESINKTARYHAGKLDKGDVDGFIDQVADASRYYAERGANSTMAAVAKKQGKGNSERKGNSKRKGAITHGIYFARVPTGATNCEFCVMLGSRGFVYLSEESAGEFDKFHRHCDCRIVPGAPGTTVEGYDPDELYDRWKHPEKYQDEITPEIEAATQSKASVQKATDAQLKAMSRSQLESAARAVAPNQAASLGISEKEALERFDLLLDANSDAQLRKYIKKYQ